MPDAKPPSNRAQAKARKEDKQANKIAQAALLRSLRQDARDLSARMPAAFGEWGVLRTRAYNVMLGMLNYRAGLITIKANELQAYVDMARRASDWSLEFCNSLQVMESRNRLFTMKGEREVDV